ncbi:MULTISPECIES: hypothetical protein [unclassified Amycolatopsis]|uniref:hypothetical protein n=1 Tax=unclassified Amycolatopsis TaxID=2618356 RepID=UPI001C6A5414|nr:hypothetical protein [Amycolatopsis sp. DSM 110486]QYN24525.1 hypothetical protein K1T34_20035 [Amycolatopsis sp. DSM 110486]
MARKSPQEKKALSYEKDRRNNYGENDKSSRKNIPRNKREPNSANRRHDRLVTQSATGPVDLDAAEQADERLGVKKSKRWRKYRDAPLADHIVCRLARRARKGMTTPEAAEERIERVRRRSRRS